MNPAVLAYANHGRWVADCPRPFCGSAELLHLYAPAAAELEACRCGHLLVPLAWDGAPVPLHCRACHAEAPVAWPEDPEEISRVLAVRGAPQFMNWYPDGHPVALAHGLPHGQTVADLHAENAEHAPEIAAWHGFPALGASLKAVT
jgi:hypothetical protein